METGQVRATSTREVDRKCGESLDYQVQQTKIGGGCMTQGLLYTLLKPPSLSGWWGLADEYRIGQVAAHSRQFTTTTTVVAVLVIWGWGSCSEASRTVCIFDVFTSFSFAQLWSFLFSKRARKGMTLCHRPRRRYKVKLTWSHMCD